MPEYDLAELQARRPETPGHTYLTVQTTEWQAILRDLQAYQRARSLAKGYKRRVLSGDKPPYPELVLVEIVAALAGEGDDGTP